MIFYSLLFVVSACTPEEESLVERLGMKPLYGNNLNDENIISKEAKAFDNLGKIVYADSLLFINESLEGIHVVDMKDPSNPENIAFIDMPTI